MSEIGEMYRDYREQKKLDRRYGFCVTSLTAAFNKNYKELFGDE